MSESASQKTSALNKAIALIRVGNTNAARPILAELLKQDPEHEQAWLWISKCFQEPERKKYCFERVLKINPSNPVASKALAALRQPEAPVTKTAAQSAATPNPADIRQAVMVETKPPLSAKAQKKQRRLSSLLSFLLSLLMVVVIAAGVWVGLNYLLPKQIPITHTELKTHLTAVHIFCGSVTATERSTNYAYVMRCGGYTGNGSVQLAVDVYSEKDPQKIDLILAYATQQSGQPDASVMGEALAYVAELPYRNASSQQAGDWVRASFPLLLGGVLEEDPVTQFGRVRFHLASLSPDLKYLAIGESGQ
jgi:hypothetical protein